MSIQLWLYKFFRRQRKKLIEESRIKNVHRVQGLVRKRLEKNPLNVLSTKGYSL